MPDEAIEGAQLAIMGERLGARDVIRRGACLLSHGEDLLGRHIQELGIRLDEAPDQPGTGDAVDLGTFTGYPLHGVLPGLEVRTLHLYRLLIQAYLDKQKPEKLTVWRLR